MESFCPEFCAACVKRQQLKETRYLLLICYYCFVRQHLVQVDHHGKCLIGDSVTQLAGFTVTKIWLILEIWLDKFTDFIFRYS